MPAIRLGGDGRAVSGRPCARAWPRGCAAARSRSTASRPAPSLPPATGPPALLLHGWLDNADTWLAVLDRLSVAGRPAIAYDLPGFGSAPPLSAGSVLDQLVEFAAAAVVDAAEESGGEVVVAGNSLGGWVALRLAETRDLPLAGVVPIGPAGIRMAPLFFTLDRVPAVSRIIGVPAPVPPAVVRWVAGRLYRTPGVRRPGGGRQGGRRPVHPLPRRAPGDP